MKRILTALAAAGMMWATPALADAPAYGSVKDAPHYVAAKNWSGVYIAGGLGYGVLSADETSRSSIPGIPCGLCDKQTLGGRGWFGTLGLGIDRQLRENIVAGVFVDADLGRINGTLQDNFAAIFPFSGRIKHDRSFAVGARGGYLVAPNVLTYMTAGYTRAHFSGVDMTNPILAGFIDSVPAFAKGGWFIGSGVEMALHSGWSWKTEYRLADYGSANVTGTVTAGGAPIGVTSAISYKPIEQTVRTEIVFKFNH